MRTGTLWNRGIMGVETQWEREHHGDGNTIGVETPGVWGMGILWGWKYHGGGDTMGTSWR